MADPNDWQDVEDWEDVPEGGAEGGAEGPSKPYVPPVRKNAGTPLDAVKSLANSAALGGGPQIEGAIAAAMAPPGQQGEAYEEVRDLGTKEHAKSDDTWWGTAGRALGMFATPIPVKGLPKGAGALKHAKQGLKVGVPVGMAHGALNSDADLTKKTKDDDWSQWAELLKDTGVGGLGGGVTGALAGGSLGAIEKPARQTARRLPMDMLGVTEPARRAMQRQGVYDAAGDDLLALVRPGRSGMRRGSLTEDAVTELQKRGEAQGETISAIDAKSGGKTVNPGSMATSVLRGAKPHTTGNLHRKAVAERMGDEAENLVASLGDEPISLARAEEFKQDFGPAAAKKLKHSGEPAARTDALADTYSAIKTANEAGAANVDPALAQKFIGDKQAYQRLAAPLEGAGVERSGLKASDFDWGEALNAPRAPMPGALQKMVDSVPVLGPAITGGLNLAGRTYGMGTAANLAEFIANRAANNSGGGVGGQLGDEGASLAADKLAPWSKFLDEEDRK